MDDLSKELLDYCDSLNLGEKFRDKHGGYHSTGGGFFIKKSPKANKITLQRKTGACHAFMNRVDTSEGVVGFANTLQYEFRSPGAMPPYLSESYLQWLMNDSPLQEAFLHKDAARAIDTKFVLMNAHNVPSNMLLAALQSQRRMWEIPHVIQTWEHLVNVGCNEALAYIIKGFLLVEAVSPTAYKVDLSLTSGQHCPVPNSASLDWCKNFINHDVKCPNPVWTQEGRYDSPNTVFSLFHKNDNVGDRLTEFLRSSLASFGKEDTEARKANPFWRAADRIVERERRDDNVSRTFTTAELASYCNHVYDKIMG